MSIFILLLSLVAAILIISGVIKKNKTLAITGFILLLACVAAFITWYYWLEKVQI